MREIYCTAYSNDFMFSISYWVIVVVPYLLFAFVTNHTQEVCEKIFKVNNHRRPHAQTYLCRFSQIPVALAMWNQVGSECQSLFLYEIQILIQETITAVLLIRTYAFFNRNMYILVALVCALAGVVAYQLYVDASQMIRQ